MNKAIKEALSFRSIIYWLGGVVMCGLGISLCTKAKFGLSMIAAGPYILSDFVKNFLPWFSQGTAEYFWEALILIITCIIIRRFKWRYLLSFAVAVVCGFVIDGWLFIFNSLPAETLVSRIICFALGTLSCSFGVACYFRTKMSLQVYELTVMVISEKWNFDSAKVKLFFDVTMLVICVTMTLIFNHSLRGIGIGTVIITFVNAPLIKLHTKLLDKLESAISGGRNK